MAQITITADQQLIDKTVAAICKVGQWDAVNSTAEEFAKNQLLRWFGQQIQTAAEMKMREDAQAANESLLQALAVAHEQTVIEFIPS